MSFFDDVLRRMLSRPTGWRLDGAAGGTASVEVASAAGVAGAIGQFFVRDPQGAQHNLEFIGADASVGIPSLSLPGSLDISTPSMEAGGLSELYWVTDPRGRSLSLSDMTGHFMEFIVSGFGPPHLEGRANSVGTSLVFLGCPTGYALLSSLAMVGGGALGHMLARAAASNVAGVMYGTSWHFEGIGSAGGAVRMGYVNDTDF